MRKVKINSGHSPLPLIKIKQMPVPRLIGATLFKEKQKQMCLLVSKVCQLLWGILLSM